MGWWVGRVEGGIGGDIGGSSEEWPRWEMGGEGWGWISEEEEGDDDRLGEG